MSVTAFVLKSANSAENLATVISTAIAGGAQPFGLVFRDVDDDDILCQYVTTGVIESGDGITAMRTLRANSAANLAALVQAALPTEQPFGTVFLDPGSGRLCLQVSTGTLDTGGGGGAGLTGVVLTANSAFNNTTTLANVSGMSFPVLAGVKYEVVADFHLYQGDSEFGILNGIKHAFHVTGTQTTIKVVGICSAIPYTQSGPQTPEVRMIVGANLEGSAIFGGRLDFSTLPAEYGSDSSTLEHLWFAARFTLIPQSNGTLTLQIANYGSSGGVLDGCRLAKGSRMSCTAIAAP